MSTQAVILSSFFNLYRNWEDHPFPCRNREGAFDCLTRAMETLPEMKLHMVSRISPTEKEEMLSQGSMTRSLLDNPESGAWCADGRGVTLLFNDREHISILSAKPGLALEKCAAAAGKYEKRLAAAHPFLRDEKLGFLASWLPHIGAGTEAGFVCHLPCLKDSIPKIEANLKDMGMTLQPLHGAEAPGDLYRLICLPSLTFDAGDQIFGLNSVAVQLTEMEEDAEERLQKDIAFEDGLWRSYALLSHARLLESKEFLALWSRLRLGAAMKLLPFSLKKAKALYDIGLPDRLTAEERARLVRNEFRERR